ncbi:MAG: 2-hydroxyacyl-CoA dehydratase [Blautia sp.]|nr:2-hydroxyacyl-CoA dehydratase [Blautia sp.]
MEVIKNSKKKPGDQNLGVLYNDGKVRKRREWRGFKDTMYDFGKWLQLWGIMIDVSLSRGFLKGLFRYRWMINYLAVPHMIDKFTIGQRDETLRITHISIGYVVKDVALTIKRCLRGDRRCGNDRKFSDKCVLVDENAMITYLMGFPDLTVVQREVPTMFSANLINQNSAAHYLDVAQTYGIPGDVCPMPETEAGISIEDDFVVMGKCAVQVNTTCDGSMLGNAIIAKRLEKEYGIPTYQMASPLRHRNEDVQEYAAEEIKGAIAFIEETTGEKWDWKAYFEAAHRVNLTTRMRWEWLDVNSTPYPQFFGAVFSLYNDTNYLGNCGRSTEFPLIDQKIMKLVQSGYEHKTMMASEYRHRCMVWGVQPQYVIDMLYWMVLCWGVVPLTDMLSMVIEKEIAETDTPENREKAYYDMAYLSENMIMRNHTHGGYETLVNELWEYCERMNADMVMMWEHMSCKSLVGMHGQFEEQARARGLHLVWVSHDLCDPRVYSRSAIRSQFNQYMRTVMQEEPLDPSIENLPDDEAW